MKKISENFDYENNLNIKDFLQAEDLCPTISSILGLDIPSFNQGNFIDEVIQSNEYTKSNLYLNYLSLRQQKQILNQEIIKSKLI